MRTVIGLEIHVQLETDSKLFCRCSTHHEGQEPNQNTCPICLGFPGAKPMVNRVAVEHGVKIARALSCQVQPHFLFSRKSYFYPDMPKNFQITQYEIPLAQGGHLLLDGRRIEVTRIHLEEDPARLVHVGGGISSSTHTLIDHNRSGVPLAEIVTEPDMASSREARLFLQKLSLILEHLGVYDPAREGSLRVDANISLEGGQRVEVKNITGFRAVEDALNYEIIRQQSMASMGIAVVRETRHYDAETDSTSTLRKKEWEEDYGYIIEPDLVRIDIDEDWIRRLKGEMPELPDARIQRFVEQYRIPRFQAGVIVNTGLDLSRFFEESCKLYPKPAEVANWIVTFLLKSLNYEGLSLRESSVRPETFVELLELIDEGTITERGAKELIKKYVNTGGSPRNIVEERGLASMAESELQTVIEEILEENKKAVSDYQAGRAKALNFLLGQVLRRISARGDPVEVKRLIKEVLHSE
ncbi:MAG: Asp-tRNA(Asn)/Glu-tRNA(Gln) amidotransferase subunit GatB [Candidatus Bathyarchaeota archaeon]|jgi:aspartyl-tRNA(Asn)/glutamyl-tRNA(Gln) amidotransferase subunit B